MTIREFYNSSIWQKQRKYKMQQENYCCARCGGVAEDVHHKITLTE
jgi:5-methylcytosine-specific restriction endonuclease McrA